MITEVNFLSVPVSRAAGENYTKDLMSGATVTVVHTIESASVTEDLDQVLIVPWFEGYSDCNMVAFNNSYYWILSAVTSTKYAKSLEIVITFNATASMVSLGDRLAGRWERTPTYNGLQENIFNTEMVSQGVSLYGELNSTLYTDNVTEDVDGEEVSLTYQAFWCQVTVKSSSGSEIRQYGFFFPFDKTVGGGVSLHHPSTRETNDVRYPSLNNVINEPQTYLPISSGEDILDISVSVRCPYAFKRWVTEGQPLSQYELDLRGSGGPYLTTKLVNNITYCVYDLTTQYFRLKPAVETVITLTPSDVVRNCGYYEVLDNAYNVIYTMPGNSPKTIRFKTISDLTGLYLLLTVGVDQRILIPEGKLPWLSDSFTQYQAYSQSFDRQLMESQVRAAKQGMAAGLAESAINGVITGALVGVAGGPAGIAAGVATGLVGAASTVYSQYVNEQETRRSQAIAEKRAYAQPDTFINSLYGMNYMRMVLETSKYIGVNTLLPVNYTDRIDASYHLQYGYNAGGTTNIYQISKGYWQGLLFKQSTLKGERLVNEFMNGQIIG